MQSLICKKPLLNTKSEILIKGWKELCHPSTHQQKVPVTKEEFHLDEGVKFLRGRTNLNVYTPNTELQHPSMGQKTELKRNNEMKEQGLRDGS